MKQQVYNFFKIRLRVLATNIVNTFNQETAYPAENWANIFSTLLYTVSYLIFLDVIFSNVTSLAGYSHNDMLFFTFVGQLAFFTLYSWSFDNMDNLVQSIRNGELDLLLTKPVPTLFYVSTRVFTIIRLVRDAIVPMLVIALLIDWHALHIAPWTIAAGFVIFVCGQWSVHVFQFLLVMPAFWNGKSQALLHLSYTVTGPEIPLHGIPKPWRIVLLSVLPVCLPTAASVSVMLGYSNPVLMMSWAIILALILTWVRVTVWRKSLGVYNSASS